ncbi:bifunctional folylpolyglutamate synthase/dihydrofolate synthase [Virgibacillus phasianinus]|uniref:tetrahydrofolate synthase n=1 Tax=Virgibacillus phasianinus TaxID=2017483 RepID=A0A220U4Z8_9BACI|nr:folylpolyglutamate synthase/dihydrofolate synthase family protein [Virgibacillus phasianinus]ASK63062.1 bifunctional folylpolyglutamate synthase/dihydrofolate synthase [Virgibacillus phasianinus]
MFNHYHEVETFFNQRKSFGIKPGLDRIKSLLKMLLNPEQKIQAIHVAGTNGKGSTIQYINNALRRNDYRVGRFISPSANGLTDHIFVNDDPISQKKFTKLMNEMYPYISQLDEQNNHPTEFEIITALAFLYFAESVDIALIEAGMGGREDTTNCFLPLLSIITNVSHDHMAFLGNTVEKIALHKAGIIKMQTPVIIGPMAAPAMQVMEREAASLQAKLYRYGMEFNSADEGQSHFIWKDRWKHNELNVSIQMIGKHQQVNASLAVMAVMLLSEQDYKIDLGKALNGIFHTTVPGRYELVNENPRIVLDGAHNEAGILSFIQAVNSIPSNHNKHVIFAAFKDKDIYNMIHLLSNQFGSIALTTFDHPRAATIDDLANFANTDNVTLENDWMKMLERVVNTPKPDTDYFVTGSLNFIAKVRKFLAEQ